MKGVKQVFGYPKLMQRLAFQFDIQFKANEYLHYILTAISGEQKGRKSRSGWVKSVLEFLFLRNSQNQTCTALSISRAEYILMWEASTDTKWILMLLPELGFTLYSPAKLYCDNTVTSLWAVRAGSMRRAKHIDLKYHFVKEFTANGIIEPQHIDLENNPANGFTKPLMKIKFERFKQIVCVKPWI